MKISQVPKQEHDVHFGMLLVRLGEGRTRPSERQCIRSANTERVVNMSESVSVAARNESIIAFVHERRSQSGSDYVGQSQGGFK